MIDTTLSTAMIKYLDENILEIHTMDDLEILISEFYEEYWEDNFDLHTRNSMAFYEAKKKIQNLCGTYHQLRDEKLNF